MAIEELVTKLKLDLTDIVGTYEEGTWTPVLSFATAGDLSVAYTTQTGVYTRVGRLIVIYFQILTSTFTHTTASGRAEISGLPFTSSASFRGVGDLAWTGITKTNYTDINLIVPTGDTLMTLEAGGSGQSLDNVNAADMPSGGTVNISGTVIYIV